MIEIAGLEFKSNSIPVTFEFQSKVYHGYLEWVAGRGGYCWDLMVNKYYWGMLMLVGDYEWRFTNQKSDMEGFADYFGDVVTAWYS